MGRAKKGPKFAAMKKLVSHKAVKQHKEEVLNPNKKDLTKQNLPRNVPYVSSVLFFTYNTALGPPYRVLVDTNFINFSIQNKVSIGTPCITDCVMAELEKLGQKYRVALRIAKDPRFERLPCTHKGTYADDCIVERVTQIPGVPIMYITQHKYSIERLPEATMGGGRFFLIYLKWIQPCFEHTDM
ncbi:PIN domain-like family protein [Artemisia annua]|uniref:PIN domain-like family protein n=1 Tax=Artemisia annua TaxID=35608 RepID=A0A2U1NYA1_ARTAN|nr:PIN domain-like family protein [Artemisia annua]